MKSLNSNYQIFNPESFRDKSLNPESFRDKSLKSSNLSNPQSRKLSGQISQIFKSLKSSIRICDSY